MERYIADKTGKKYTAKQMRLKVVNELTRVIKTSDRLDIKRANNYIIPIKRTALIQFDSPRNANKELEPLLKNCRVCALGALFLADLIIRDEYKALNMPSHGLDQFSMINRLKPYFTEKQLELIERAFEGHCSCFHNHLPKHNPTCTCNLKKTDAPDKHRLLYILKNIKDNEGTLKITKKWLEKIIK